MSCRLRLHTYFCGASTSSKLRRIWWIDSNFLGLLRCRRANFFVSCSLGRLRLVSTTIKYLVAIWSLLRKNWWRGALSMVLLVIANSIIFSGDSASGCAGGMLVNSACIWWDEAVYSTLTVVRVSLRGSSFPWAGLSWLKRSPSLSIKNFQLDSTSSINQSKIWHVVTTRIGLCSFWCSSTISHPHISISVGLPWVCISISLHCKECHSREPLLREIPSTFLQRFFRGVMRKRRYFGTFPLLKAFMA